MTNPNAPAHPFMTSVGGHVLIHNGETGAPLADHWTGICVDGSDTKKFWLIGRDGHERSFVSLRAIDLDGAKTEAAGLQLQEAHQAVDETSAFAFAPRQRA